jgi:hypothetical protein
MCCRQIVPWLFSCVALAASCNGAQRSGQQDSAAPATKFDAAGVAADTTPALALADVAPIADTAAAIRDGSGSQGGSSDVAAPVGSDRRSPLRALELEIIGRNRRSTGTRSSNQPNRQKRS